MTIPSHCSNDMSCACWPHPTAALPPSRKLAVRASPRRQRRSPVTWLPGKPWLGKLCPSCPLGACETGAAVGRGIATADVRSLESCIGDECPRAHRESGIWTVRVDLDRESGIWIHRKDWRRRLWHRLRETATVTYVVVHRRQYTQVGQDCQQDGFKTPANASFSILEQ